jgi:predicted ATPase/predicted Ser/Thr protein kinase
VISTTISHYRILEKLGAGGMGEVYLAEDTKLGRKVALKLLPAAFTTNDERVRRFEQEARAASALNHPNIITIHEIGEAEAGRFIVMEYVQGRTLRALINDQPSIELILTWGIQIAKALGVAHAAGIIHRDIKPENLMVRDDGYVKVLDFGLARLAPNHLTEADADTQTGSMPGALVGTMLYMSPEQARGEQAGVASDIFSLGIVLYELATRRHPFRARSTLAVLQAITSQLVSAPSRINPAIRTDFEVLLMRMLEKDAQIRPSAGQVEAALGESGGEQVNGKVGSSAFALLPPRPSELKIVGRERERADLRAGFKSAMAGRSMMLCVAGEPGIGKTTLVEDFLHELIATDQPCRIARGRCSERLSGTGAYLPWLEALDSLIQSEAGESLARTMKFSNESATRVMKLIAPTWYMQVAPLPSEVTSEVRMLSERTAASQERMKMELSALVQELTRSRPLILFFDDLHWSDASTIDLLTYLAGKFETMRLLIVVTYRTSDLLLARHPFLQVKPDLQARGLCREITLEFLIRSEIERYLSVEFPSHHFPDELTSLIHTKTEGNPLFMTDLARYLRDRRVIVEEVGQWVLAGSLPQIERDLPESVRGMIERKIAQLGEEDRRLLIAASVQGSEFDSALVATALEMDPGEVEERLENLERIHAFVRLIGEKEFPDHTLTLRYRFVHVLYQNALYALLRPTRRIALSSAMARGILGFYGEKSVSVASELAHLFSIAREFAQATDYFFIAARDAAEVFAFEEAAALARRGLEMLRMTPDVNDRANIEMGLHLILGSALSMSRGHSLPDAGKSMTRARELCQQIGEPPQLFTVIFALWAYYIVGAKLEDARQMGEQLLRMAERAQDPILLLGGHYTLGTTMQFLGRLPEGQEHLTLATSYYDPNKRKAYKSLYRIDPGIYCYSEMVRTLWLQGYPDQARRKLDVALELARASNDPKGMAFVMVKAVLLYQYCHETQQAEEWAEKCIAHCDQHGAAQERLWAKSLCGWSIAAQGRVEQGIEWMRTSIDAYRALRSELSLSHYQTLLADVLGFTGNAADGLVVIAEALDTVNRTCDRHNEAETYRTKGALLLRQSSIMDSGIVTNTGDRQVIEAEAPVCAEAESCFRHAIELAQRQGAKSWELRAATSLSQLWQQQGRRDEARQLLTPVYQWFSEGFDTADLKEARALLEELA